MARSEPRTLPIEALAPCRRHLVRLPKVSAGMTDLVRRYGVFSPVVARPLGGSYEILSNLVTWLAAQRVGIDRVPVSILEPIDDEAADEILALDADGPLDRAEHYHRALDAVGGAGRHGAIARVARQFGVNRTTVSHALRLRDLPEEIRHAIAIGALRGGHAKVLAGIADADRQHRLAARVIAERWSVRQLEREAAGQGAAAAAAAPAARRSPDLVRLETVLSGIVGSSVTIREEDGVLEIDYRRDLDVLEGVLERLGYRG